MTIQSRIIVLILGIEWENIDVIHYAKFTDIGYSNGDNEEVHCDVTNTGSIKQIMNLENTPIIA